MVNCSLIYYYSVITNDNANVSIIYSHSKDPWIPMMPVREKILLMSVYIFMCFVCLFIVNVRRERKGKGNTRHVMLPDIISFYVIKCHKMMWYPGKSCLVAHNICGFIIFVFNVSFVNNFLLQQFTDELYDTWDYDIWLKIMLYRCTPFNKAVYFLMQIGTI